MSIDRYIAICHQFSLKWQKLRKPRTSNIVTIVVWTFAIVYAFPIFFFSDTRGIREDGCFCEIIYPFNDIRNLCESYLLQYPGFNYTCSVGRCVSSQEVTDLDAALLEYFNNRLNTSIVSFDDAEFASYEDYFSDSSGFSGSAFPDVDEIETGCVFSAKIAGPLLRGQIWSNFAVMFLIPILVMSVCYGLIIKKLRHTSAAMKRHRETSADTSRNRERVLTILCICLVVVFTICWLLYHVVEITKLVDSSDKIVFRNISDLGCTLITEISAVLVYINSALNPYLYTFLGFGFKRQLQIAKSSFVARQILKIPSRTRRIFVSVQSRFTHEVDRSEEAPKRSKAFSETNDFVHENPATSSNFLQSTN